MTEQNLFELMQETSQAFTPFYQEEIREAVQQTGVQQGWYALLLARGSDPDPFTAQRFHDITPYSDIQAQIDILSKLAEDGFLKKTGNNAYRLTDSGRNAVTHPFVVAYAKIAQLNPLPEVEITRLCGLVGRLVEGTRSAEEPAEKWSMLYSRATAPEAEGSIITRTEQYLTDMGRFRDDAHIAAWKQLDVDGPTWEALTFVWRGDASSASELAQKLEHRRLSEERYQTILQKLVKRGWLQSNGKKYELSAAGRDVREKAEAETDRIFEIGLADFKPEEKTQLFNLLTRLRDSLKEMAPQPVPA